MTVRAKFRVQNVSVSSNGRGDSPATTITLVPVTHGSPENESFYRYTPCGSISLSTVNESAASQFELGAEYYVDFTKADN